VIVVQRQMSNLSANKNIDHKNRPNSFTFVIQQQHGEKGILPAAFSLADHEFILT
jgi:hypothetical protein